MFGREKKADSPVVPTPSGGAPAARIETVIGPNAHFKGDVVSEGGIRIDGIFEGHIETTGNLVIGESAKLIAEITANNISISGAVKGNIAGNRVEILETGRVWGDLTITSLLLNEGAYLQGRTNMHADIAPPQLEAPKSRSTAESLPSDSIVDVEPIRRYDEE
ncbi:MAG: polymer-forming cytoskeletal protein [Anaerolineae bacterium]|nr:polymer-forming cytoskeletal protein [Anaerolineae bacterium]